MTAGDSKDCELCRGRYDLNGLEEARDPLARQKLRMELVHRIQSHRTSSSAQAEEGKERRACAYSVITVSCITAKPLVEGGIKGRVGIMVHI